MNKVVNRIVFLVAAIILMIAGFIPVFSAALTTIPQSVIGGATLSVFAQIAICPHRGVFYTLSKLKLHVSGDIGCYTLGAVAPLSAIDTVYCMGASISALHGSAKVRGDKNTRTAGKDNYGYG